MAVGITRTNVIAIKEETTEGTLIDPAGASEFIAINEGSNIESVTETLDSVELNADIGASKSFVSKESPVGTIEKYIKHSGTEGTAPEWGPLIKASLGTETIGTERDTVAGSTAGTSAARATLVVDTGEGSEFETGRAVLIKDSTNNYSIRNVRSVSTDTLTLNYNLSAAPASGVNLGQSVHYSPAVTGIPTLSVHHYQNTTGSFFYQAMAGARTTTLDMAFPAADFATVTATLGGIAFYWLPIRITSGSNDALDFNDGGGEENATITAKVYNNPHELAREIQTKMDALTGDTITVTYSNTDGKFTIATSGGTLSLLWNTGTNTATTIGAAIGFATAADDTGATTYTSDNAQSFNPGFTPTFDGTDNLVMKNQELLLGSFDRITCIKTNTVSFTIDTPKTDVNDLCAATGVDSSAILSREVTFAATIILQQYEAEWFDKFINNTTTEMMLNIGTKTAGNWDAGKAVNFYSPQMSFTGHVVSETDGYHTIDLEGRAFVSSSQKDFHINFL